MTISRCVMCRINSSCQIGICALYNIIALCSIVVCCFPNHCGILSLDIFSWEEHTSARMLFCLSCDLLNFPAIHTLERFFNVLVTILALRQPPMTANFLLAIKDLWEQRKFLFTINFQIRNHAFFNWDLDYFCPFSRIAQNSASTTHHIHSRAGHNLA